jgi:hypothetical protein
MATKKTIQTTKVYTVKSIIYSDGTTTLERTNDGYSSMELLGLLEMSQMDIIEQIKGVIKPDFIERKVIVDKVKKQKK